MSRLLGYNQVASDESGKVDIATNGINSFGSPLVYGHYQSFDHSFVWVSPFSLPSVHQSYYNPVTASGNRRLRGDAEAMHKRQKVRTTTYWRSAFSFPATTCKGKSD